MQDIIIQIGWPQFIGIITAISGFLMGIAWFSGNRFSALESDVRWLKESVRDLSDSLRSFGVQLVNLAGEVRDLKATVNMMDGLRR